MKYTMKNISFKNGIYTSIYILYGMALLSTLFQNININYLTILLGFIVCLVSLIYSTISIIKKNKISGLISLLVFIVFFLNSLGVLMLIMLSIGGHSIGEPPN